MLAFKISPALPVGRVFITTQLYLDDVKSVAGESISENTQPLDIEIVKFGVFLEDRQGAMYDYINLPVELSKEANIPWVPAGADEQWIKDYLDKYVTTEAFAATLAKLGGASKNLSNVDDKDFEKKAKASNFAQNDLKDVDLDKLKEKGQAAKLALDDLSNVPTNIFNRLVRMSAAYQKLANIPHPATQGKTDEEIKALFSANKYEVRQEVDLTIAPYNKSTTLSIAYQMSDGQTVQQVLPPVADNRIIIVSLLQQPGASNYKVVLSPADTDKIDGSSAPITLTRNGVAGILVPILNESTWDWIPYSQVVPSYIGASDDKGNVVPDVKALHFKTPLFIEHDDTTGETSVNVDGVTGGGVSAEDGLTGETFAAKKIKSLDKSIRIAKLGVGRDASGKETYDMDLSIAQKAGEQGVAMVADYTQIVNLSLPDIQPSLSNVLYSGGMACYLNRQTGGIVTQEIDEQDPNVTGGSTFIALLDYVPNPEEDNIISQDGTIRLALTDKDGNFITDINGKLAVVEREYKAGATVQEMHLAVVFRMKNYTEVFYKLSGDFASDEIISVGIGTGMCVQAIEKNSGSGEALSMYETYTGNHVEIGKVIYAENNINFARTVINDSVLVLGGNETINLGDNLVFDARTNLSYQIIKNGFNIKSGVGGSCVFSVYKKYNAVDLKRLKGCDIDISAELANKQNAFSVVMLGYKGTLPAPEPILLSFANSQPVYAAGWTQLDSLFISEDPVSDKHKVTKTFTFPMPEDYDACVFMFRPNDNSTPLDATLYDFEGDIKPALTYVLIRERYFNGQQALIKQNTFTKSVIQCPDALLSLRFTINDTDTKIPVGIFKPNAFVKNNNAWYDAGSSEKELQGDMEILKSFKGKLSYSLNIFNETNTDSAVTVWLAKVEADGSFTKIQESELVVTVKANTAPTTANEITLPAFSHSYKKGESYRLFAKADKVDGAYIICDNGSHVPMVEITLNVEYFTEIPEDVIRINGLGKIQLTDGGVEVRDPENYIVQVDVNTGTITVKKK